MNFQINRSSSHFVTFHLKFHSIFNKKQYKTSLKNILSQNRSIYKCLIYNTFTLCSVDFLLLFNLNL